MENKKFTITIPTLPFAVLTNALVTTSTSIKQKLQNIYTLFLESTSENYSRTKKRFTFPKLSMRNKFGNSRKNSKKILSIIIPLIVIIILVTIAVQTVKQSRQPQSVNAESSNSGILDATEVNKPFSFPLTDEAGKKIGEFSYEVQQAELRNEIILKGQPAYAASGRVFLIVNLELKNDLKQGLQINSRDYVRLSVNGNKNDLLAPEIHNDPVEVQAISTKFTRIGFAINSKDKDFVLIVGEIDGDKQEIPVKF
jgi:hypothetical protein